MAYLEELLLGKIRDFKSNLALNLTNEKNSILDQVTEVFIIHKYLIFALFYILCIWMNNFFVYIKKILHLEFDFNSFI